jgi:hypothetical protein
MELTAAATGLDAMLDTAARQEWLASCEAAYATDFGRRTDAHEIGPKIDTKAVRNGSTED